jgi:uncharacterized protein YodC (DUF2158 family)
MMLIKPGDVVWLKSGGPKMTVAAVTPENICGCIWFQHGEILQFEFEISALRKSDPFYDEEADSSPIDKPN